MEYLKPTIGKNQSGMNDHCIFFADNGNGTATIYSTNLIEFTSLDVVLNSVGTEQVNSSLIEFNRLYKIVETILPINEITLRQSENNLEIRYTNQQNPIVLVGISEMMPQLPEIQENTNVLNVSKEMIDTCIKEASRIIIDNKDYPIYNCMRLKAEGATLEFTAVDITNKRTYGSRKTIANEIEEPIEVLFELSKLSHSLMIFEDFSTMSFLMTQNIICVRANDIVENPRTNGKILNIKYYMRRLSGLFPNGIMNYFNQLPNEYAVINKDELKTVIARIYAIGDAQNICHGVSINANDSTCLFTFTSSKGTISEEIDLGIEIRTPFHVILNIKALEDIVNAIGEDYISIGKKSTLCIVKGYRNQESMFSIPIITTQ